MANAPVFVAKVSGITVNIWENEITVKGEKVNVQSINVIKPYKKDGKWVNGNSFKFTDIPAIQRALQLAYDWKYVKEMPDLDTDGFDVD